MNDHHRSMATSRGTEPGLLALEPQAPLRRGFVLFRDHGSIAAVRCGRSIGIVLLCASSAASAQEVVYTAEPPIHDEHFSLRSDSTFQAYEVRSPRSPMIWRRRRFEEAIHAEYGDSFGDEAIRFRVSTGFRLARDFGDDCIVGADDCLAVTDADSTTEYQVLADPTQIEATEALVELWSTARGFRIRGGRQLVSDATGLARVDGGFVRYAPWEWLALSAYAGMLVRQTSFLGSDAFAPEGSLRLNVDDVEAERIAFVAEPSSTWVVGTQVEAGVARWSRGVVAFREMQDGDGIVARRLSLAWESAPLESLRVSARGVLDLLDVSLIDLLSEIELHFDESLIRLSYRQFEPRFDAGTIWAFFDVVASRHAAIEYRWIDEGRWSFGAALRGRHAKVDQVDEWDGGGDAWVDFQLGAYTIGISASASFGALAPLAWCNATVDRTFLSDRLAFQARTSVWYIDDPVRDDAEAISYALGLGSRFQITSVVNLHADGDYVYNRFVGHRFRASVGLTLEVSR